MSLLFFLVPLAFLTSLKDPFFIKEPLAQTLILLASGLWLLKKSDKPVVAQSPIPAFAGTVGDKLIGLHSDESKAPDESGNYTQVLKNNLMNHGAYPIFWVTLASGFLFLFSILFSLKNAVHPPLVWRFFFWQLLLVLLFFLSSRLEEQEKDKIFLSIGAASLIAGSYGMLQHFGWDFVPWVENWGGRPGSAFGNPNFAAGWWIMVLPLFIGYFFSNLAKTEKLKNRFLGSLVLPFLGIVLSALNLYWTKTRGAWIAEGLAILITGFIWLFVVKIKPKHPKLFYAAHALGILLFIGALSLPITNPRLLMTNDSMIQRIFKWHTALEMVKDYPAFGVGAGNMKVHYALYQAKVREKINIALKSTSELNVHHEFFQIWAEQGSFGLIAFLLIFGVWYWKVIIRLSFPSRQRREESRGVNVKSKTMDSSFRWNDNYGMGAYDWSVFISILAFFFFCFTNFPLHTVPTACLLFFLMGTFCVSSNCDSNPSDTSSRARIDSGKNPGVLSLLKDKPWIPAFAGMTLVVFIFWFFILPPIRAEYNRAEGEKFQQQKNYDQAIAFYQKAIELDFYRSERTAYHLGECYRALGDYSKAIQAYEIAVQLRNYGEVYNNMGNCYYLLRRFDDAIKNWEIAVRLGLPDPSAQQEAENNLKIIKEVKP
jgi:O-antigen ligase